MSDTTDNFLAWVSDPQRSSDQLFTVECLIERSRSRQDWPFRDRAEPFDELLEKLKARKFNPAYRPVLERDEVEHLHREREKATHFRGHALGDRLLRDIEALRFFPGLEDVSLASSDLSDLSPLRDLLKIKRLDVSEYGDIGGHHALQFSQCGEMPVLDLLHLSLRYAWPDLRALAHWPVLRELRFNGNILAWLDVETLPAVEVVYIHGWVNLETPLRDLRRFPTMPKVKLLGLKNISSLDGIERYPTVLNLELGGDFRDLSPLTALPHVTYLKLTGEFFADLTPLTRMPSLREIVFVRERPLDLSVLTDAPHLRRVEYERCAIIRTELGALNAALIPEETDFLAETPRPLAPLKLYRIGPENKAGSEWFRRTDEEIAQAREKHFGGDLALAHAEYRSANTTLQRCFDQLLGRGWGLLSSSRGSFGGQMHLSFKRYQDTLRIREIIQLLRQFSAAQRFPWGFLVSVEPHGDMSYELEQLKELDEQAKEPEGHWLKKYFQPDAVLKENDELAQRYEESYELLEREHLYHLQQQQGVEIDPRLTEPLPESPPAATEPPEDETEEESLTENTGDDDDEGGVAIAPPPPAPPGTDSLGEELSYYLQLRENFVLSNRDTDRASYALGLEPEDLNPESVS